MPKERARSNIGRYTRRNRNVGLGQVRRTAEQHLRANQIRSRESEDQRNERSQVDNLRRRQSNTRLTSLSEHVIDTRKQQRACDQACKNNVRRLFGGALILFVR